MFKLVNGVIMLLLLQYTNYENSNLILVCPCFKTQLQLSLILMWFLVNFLKIQLYLHLCFKTEMTNPNSEKSKVAKVEINFSNIANNFSSLPFREASKKKLRLQLSAPSDHTRIYYNLPVKTLLYGLQAKFKGGTTGGATWHHHLYWVVPPIHWWCHVAPPPLLGGATTVLLENCTF